jgi:hypothetical protein
VHSTTYSDRLTELKGLQKLSKDWYLLKFFDVFICFMDRVGFKLMFLIHLIQEQGDLKLRVRTLESERAFQRVAAVQRTVGNVSLADFHQLIEDFFFQLGIIVQIINLFLFTSFSVSSIIKKRICETWRIIGPWGFQGQDLQNKEKKKEKKKT